MKYALSILILSLSSMICFDASARTITSFKESDAITAVAQFMYDVAEDMPVSSRLSDKKINVKDLSKCSAVTADEVLADSEAAIKRVLRFYPDEEIPFDQAVVDLEDYLDHKSYKKCIFEKKSAQSLIKSTYYVDSSDKIHLRLDNVALTAE